jgi:hypothetical protein
MLGAFLVRGVGGGFHEHSQLAGFVGLLELCSENFAWEVGCVEVFQLAGDGCVEVAHGYVCVDPVGEHMCIGVVGWGGEGVCNDGLSGSCVVGLAMVFTLESKCGSLLVDCHVLGGWDGGCAVNGLGGSVECVVDHWGGGHCWWCQWAGGQVWSWEVEGEKDWFVVGEFPVVLPK